MRSDARDFAAANTAVSRKPRYVVQILFSDSSPSFTSRLGISGVPGDVYEETIAKISSVSQQVWPEEGRTTIGTLTVDLVETAANGITEELRSQLMTLDPADVESARGKELRVYVGFTDTFADFQLVNTMFISEVAFAAGTYTIQAKDKTRELRTTILEPKTTVLTAAISASATTITVADTSEFAMVPHGTSFQDAPSTTVGYARLEDTGEIFRYTGKTSTTFTGVTRGVFGTKAQEIAYDSTKSRDSWPKVTEIIYLELPGPLAILAVLTGVLDPLFPVPVLPDHWHMGLTYATDLSHATFNAIGTDLIDTSDLTLGFPVRFIDPGSVDGKAFVEKELCQLLGVYMFASSDGKLALRRMNRVLPENGFVATLNADNVASHGQLKHDYNALLNSFRVNYNWTGKDFTRSVLIVDAKSAATHGAGDQKVLEFKGLHTARHTERAVRERIRTLRERYGSPPLRLQAKCDPTTNPIEIGDIVRVTLEDIQDYTLDQDYLDRTFEVQKVQVDWVNGMVDLDLFASTAPPADEGDNEDTAPALADAWYTSIGTNMSTLTGYVAAAGATPARLSANITLTGLSTELRLPSSTWYHNGDLTIDAGVTVTVVNQAQFRVKGFLQVNGKVDLKGKGAVGGSDTDTVGAASTGFSKSGTSGFLGPTRSADGIWIYSFDVYDQDQLLNAPGRLLSGFAGGTAAPRLALDVVAGQLVSGLPRILSGTSGSTGGQVTEGHSTTYGTVRARGGNGGAAGGGLAIICRGLGFGPSGVIDTSGLNGSNPISSGIPVDATAYDGHALYDCPAVGGGGGGGYPGALYVLLDGDSVPYPDISAATFVANRGDTTITGTSAGATYPMRGVTELRYANDTADGSNVTGRNEYWQGPGANMWPVAHQVQYLPSPPAVLEEPIPPPKTLAATAAMGQVSLAWTWPVAVNVADVEVWASTSNNRAFANLVAEVAGGAYTHPVDPGQTMYYWVRARGAAPDPRASAWLPASPTGGISATADHVATGDMADAAATEVYVSEIAGPVDVIDVSSPYTWTTIDSISVPAQSVDTEQILVFTGSVEHHIDAGQASSYARIQYSGVGYPLAAFSGAHAEIARNISTADPEVRSTFSIELAVTVLAGTAMTYNFEGVGGGAAFTASWVNLQAMTCKVIVVKR